MTETTTIRYFKVEDLSIDEADGRKRITGLAVPYNAPSEDLGGFREIFKPGAFKESLNSGDDVFADVEHDRSKKLGRMSKGTVELKETREGLRATIYPPDTGIGRDTIQEIRDGLLDGMSISFSSPTDMFRGKGDSIFREISKAKLRAVTLTSYPAYPQTAGTLAERSLAEYKQNIDAENQAEAEKAEAAAKAEAEQRAAEESAAKEADVKAAQEAAMAENQKLRDRIELEEAML